MAHHLQKEINLLKESLIRIGALTEESVTKAIHALNEKDDELADSVIEGDKVINDLEMEIEENCLKVIALHQPVAKDLRYLSVMMKVNNEFERIADIASNIAEHAHHLSKNPDIEAPYDYKAMGEVVCEMQKKSLDSYVKYDQDLAVEVMKMDDQVDEMHAEMYGKVKEAIVNDPANIDTYINYMTLSKHLERIADHAENVANDIYYMICGESSRHKSWS